MAGLYTMDPTDISPEEREKLRLKDRAKSLKTALNPAEVAPVQGIGPVASGEEYGRSLQSAMNQPAPSVPEEKAAKQQADSSIKQVDKTLAAVMKSDAPPEQKDALMKTREEAYAAYNDARTRNEWLDVAQTLAQALAQYGAATSGRAQSGRDMTLPNMPKVDFTGRTATSERELERRLRDVDTSEKSQQELAKEAKQDQRFQDELAYKRERDKKEFAYKDATREAKLDPIEKMKLEEEIRACGETRRNEAKTATEVEASREELKSVYAALKNPDLSDKERDFYEKRRTDLEGKGRIDRAKATNESQSPTIWNRMGLGKGTYTDTQKEDANIAAQLAKKYGQSSGQAPAPSASIQQAPPTSGKVRVQKGTEILEIDEADLPKAIADKYVKIK